MVDIDKKTQILELIQTYLDEYVESLKYAYNSSEEDDKLLLNIVTTKRILNKIKIYG